MNTGTMELNMNEMEMVNGGFSVWDVVAQAVGVTTAFFSNPYAGKFFKDEIEKAHKDD